MDLEKYIEKYVSNIHETDRSFELYKNIKLNVGTEEDKVNKYDTLFITILSSLQYSYILNLSKLLLKDEGKNIYKMIENCRNHKMDSERRKELNKILNEFETKLNNKQDIIDKIKFLRDKHFAHADTTYFLKPNEAFSKAHLRGEDIEEIIKIIYAYTEKICNILNYNFKNGIKDLMNWELDRVLNKI